MLLKRWHDRTFYVGGEPLTLKLKALSFGGSADFLRKLMAASKAAEEAKKDPANLETMFTTIDAAWAKDVFTKSVRLSGSLEVDEGVTITTGAELFEEATPGLVIAVLFQLQKLALVTEAEGKASSSPSTSEPAGTSDAGGSPATSTVPADGPTP